MYYTYHPETFELLRVLQRKPKTTENTTQISPYSDGYLSYSYLHSNYVYVFNPEKQEWKKCNEYREYRYDEKGKLVRTCFKGYRLPLEGDSSDTPVRYNKNIEPLPDGAVIGDLPELLPMIKELKVKFRQEYDKKILQLLEMENFELIFYHRERSVKYGEQIWEIPTISFSIEIAIKLNLLTRAATGSLSALDVIEKEYGENAPTMVLVELDKARIEYLYNIQWLAVKEKENSYKDIFSVYNKYLKNEKDINNE